MDTLLHSQDEFSVWQPFDLVKGAEEERRIRGFASTEALDRQNEIVLQKGLDFSEFVEYGYFNDNHSQATAAVVGVPDSAEFVMGKGWLVSGHIIKGTKRADEIWELAKSLQNTKRRLGFSIEGKVIERRDNYVVKARIRNVAVTNCPVNTNCTWEIVAKSFDPDMEKALSAGADRVAESGGRVLMPEDLEKITCPKCGHAHSPKEPHSKLTRKSNVMSVEEAAVMIKRLRPHFSVDTCLRIAKFAAR